MVENPLQLHRRPHSLLLGWAPVGSFSEIPSMCFPQFRIHPFACLCSRGYLGG